MKELWLNYEDKDGEAERVLVEQDSFVIGRHSSNDLSIASGKLSREHAKIDKFGDVYILSDLNSSNGTILNGSEIDEPIALKDGDSIDFGGGLQVSVELASDEPEDDADDSEESSDGAGAAPSVSASSGAGGGVPTSFFFLAPILGLVVLLCVGGGLFFAYSDGSGGEKAGGDEYEFSTPDKGIEDKPENGVDTEDTPKPEDTKTPEKTSEENSTDLPEQTSTPEEIPDTPKPSNETEKVRAYSASFLPRIVSNDPNAFLLDKNIQILLPKINQFKSSSALASNFKQVKQNSSQIQTIANEAGLKPQFLATAALAKIGNNKGDVVTTAKSMAETLQKLKGTIGIESADDATLVVAAYPQGAAGQFTQMRTMIEVLSGQNAGGASARQIRTIWFLNQNGKLKPNEFDLALQFLAIGTIMQNPSEFNVKAEPVILN